jgi:hypothetical protein
MKFSDHRKIDIDRNQWEAYKQLELVPDAVAPKRDRVTFKFGIDRAWRVLISLLMDELVTEQKVEYLDRCWEANALEVSKRSASQTLKRFLTLIS